MPKADPPSTPELLLIGNGSYRNRGCEAIVRGTMEILRDEFGPDVRALAAVFAPPAVIAKQNVGEREPGLRAFPMLDLKIKKYWKR